MKVLEHRRHSRRVDRSKPMSHLSQTGLNLAKSIDNLLDSYDIVITSTLQRAMETAVAMGHAITYTDKRLNTYGQLIEDIVRYPLTFEMISKFLLSNIHFQKFAKEQLSLYQKIIYQLPSSGNALIVSHGGVIDIPLVAIFPEEDHRAWGEYPLDYCEGFRIQYNEEEEKFVEYELLRFN